tara:strand:+ start:84 stop:221 length:138 start_codon:yes stop_codon:yes gene_type:complete
MNMMDTPNSQFISQAYKIKKASLARETPLLMVASQPFFKSPLDKY